jgi:hypothetical protein
LTHPHIFSASKLRVKISLVISTTAVFSALLHKKELIHIHVEAMGSGAGKHKYEVKATDLS